MRKRHTQRYISVKTLSKHGLSLSSTSLNSDSINENEKTWKVYDLKP